MAVLHISKTPFMHASRALKECYSLLELRPDEHIFVAALWGAGLESEEEINNQISLWRVKLRSRSWPKNFLIQTIKYLEWGARIIARMRKKRLSLIHAHSLAALPIAIVLKWMTGAPVVYDAHELESIVESGLREKVAAGRLPEDEARSLLDDFRDRLDHYTYLD